VAPLAPISVGSSETEALRRCVPLARRVEALGYRRFWVAEHYNMPSIASSAPEVLIAHIVDAATSICVGSGGPRTHRSMLCSMTTPLTAHGVFGFTSAEGCCVGGCFTKKFAQVSRVRALASSNLPSAANFALTLSATLFDISGATEDPA